MVKLSGLAILAATLLLAAVDAVPSRVGEPPLVVFDLPATVACRDATPQDFAAAHPHLKVIEARFRISARLVAGEEADIEDFLYIVASGDKLLRFQDYLPNTMLESKVALDQIEITDTTERGQGGEVGVHVGYQGAGGGISRSRSTKQAHATHYQEIAPKALVVASGTTDHERGIFFKLKPSRAASLEGAKEFTFLAIVPKSWRGGWCTISCAARARSRTMFYRTTIVPAGVAQWQVGLYLAGDLEANGLADELAAVQEAHADILAGHVARASLLETMYEAALSGKTAALCGVFRLPAGYRTSAGESQLDRAHAAVVAAQQRLESLSE